MSVVRSLSRFATVALAAGFAVGFTAPPAFATEDSGQGAAGWLASQAEGGDWGTPGMAADAIFGFVSADVGKEYTTEALNWMDDPAVLSPYIGNATDGFMAPQLAKVLLAVQAGGGDTGDFGGVDLETELRDLEGPDGVYSGGYTSVLGQSLAVLSLARSQSGVSATGVDALGDGQCANGSFGFVFDMCDDVDATGYAVSALLAAGDTAAADKALDWLEDQQKTSGGFVAGYPGAPENTNSTGIAGQALAAGGRDTAAARAADFIVGLQNGCDTAEADRGAIAYDNSGYDPGNAIMSTAQAIPALTGEGLDTLNSTDDVAGLPGLDCDGDSPSPTPTPTNSSSPTEPGDTNGSDKLPVTGSSLTTPVIVGVAALLVGGVLLVAARRRQTGERS